LIIMHPYWYGRHYGMMPGNGWWFGFEILGFLLLVVFLLLLYRNYMKHKARIAGPPTALDIAKDRLAKGEITPEEFAAMKEHLK
jgi:putative membrane protein